MTVAIPTSRPTQNHHLPIQLSNASHNTSTPANPASAIKRMRMGARCTTHGPAIATNRSSKD